MTDLEILEAARAKIADPKHWTKGAWARGSEGQPLDRTDPDATCWCALAALYAVAKDYRKATQLDAFLGRSALDLTEENILQVNDDMGHKEVLRVYDHAIERARS